MRERRCEGTENEDGSHYPCDLHWGHENVCSGVQHSDSTDTASEICRGRHRCGCKPVTDEVAALRAERDEAERRERQLALNAQERIGREDALRAERDAERAFREEVQAAYRGSLAEVERMRPVLTQLIEAIEADSLALGRMAIKAFRAAQQEATDA